MRFIYIFKFEVIFGFNCSLNVYFYHNACNRLSPLGSSLSVLTWKLLLHTHPLLGNGLVNKFPRREILGKQSIARLRNNSRKRSVFSVVHAMPRAKQQNCKDVYNNRCFLWCPCRRFIGGSKGRLQSVITEKP
jgi:hypothetical protein